MITSHAASGGLVLDSGVPEDSRLGRARRLADGVCMPAGLNGRLVKAV